MGGLASSIVTGQKTLTGGADQLTSTSTQLEGLAVMPVTAAGNIFIGAAGVTTSDGCLLPASGLAIDIDDPTKVYLRGTAGDVVSFIGARVVQ